MDAETKRYIDAAVSQLKKELLAKINDSKNKKNTDKK